jgi:hypothetical protein
MTCMFTAADDRQARATVFSCSSCQRRHDSRHVARRTCSSYESCNYHS